MSDRERLKAMIAPRSHDGGSWFVAHFKPHSGAAWDALFVAFMDLRHRLNADIYPCKYFEYCLIDGFNWADEETDKKRTRPPLWDEQSGVKYMAVGHEDCEPITAGQYSQDAGPIAEANRAAWRDFMERHRLDKEITRAADEMQPGIDYYNTHNDFIRFGGPGIFERGRPKLCDPAPLPAWLAVIVAQEPPPRKQLFRGQGRGMRNPEHTATP